MHLRALLLIATLAQGSFACGADPPAGSSAPRITDCTPEPSGEVELGSGIQAFEAISEGQDLLLTPGFQGGYHFYGSVRSTSLNPRDARIDFLICQNERTVGQRFPITVDLREDGSYSTYSGVTVFLYEDLGPPQLQDQETIMAVQVIDRDGVVATDSARFMARCCGELR